MSCNSQNRVFRLCLKTSLPHHTSRFLALNEWFFAFATNGDIQFGDKFRPRLCMLCVRILLRSFRTRWYEGGTTTYTMQCIQLKMERWRKAKFRCLYSSTYICRCFCCSCQQPHSTYENSRYIDIHVLV